MKEDLLLSSTRALRDSASESNPARLTRARVMRSLHERRARSNKKLAFLLPIAAVLVGSTAWGAASGRLPTQWQTVKTTLGVSAAPASQSLSHPLERGAQLARSVPRPVAEPAPAPEAVPAVLPAAAPEAEKATPAAARAPEDPAQELYRVAHRRHFAEGDAAGALSAWDAYLAAAPRGRFSTEARYNRALCLVRLGRTAEAVTALEPFAAGRFGGYRQREASALAEALGSAK